MRFLISVLLLFTSTIYFSQVEENNNIEPTSNSLLNNKINADSTKRVEKDKLFDKEDEEAGETSVEDDGDLHLFEIQRKKELKARKARKKNMNYESAPSQEVKKISSFKSESIIKANNKIYKNKKISTSQSYQRNPTDEQQKEMNQANDIIQQQAPNSFDYNLNKYVIGNYNTNNYSNLKSAEQINPNSEEVIKQMAAHNLIIDDDFKSELYLKKLKDNKQLDAQSIDYCEDLLESTPENGTLITHGMLDSYGAHYNQITNKKRTDVEIINLDFLQSKTYQQKLIKKGFFIPDSKNIDVSFFKEFCENNNDKNIALSLTIPKDYFIPIIDKIYVVGLVFEYHLNTTPDGLMKKNEVLWNNKMNKSIISSKETGTIKLASNYLPMLLNLRKYFKEKGDNPKVLEIDRQIELISKKCNKTKKVSKIKSSY
ncbi:MAG: hypothetical protein CL824_03770 [Crocinitomicaceae bacterium]|nr:hypothetical protein [Crocinitomicaceae bacterium]